MAFAATTRGSFAQAVGGGTSLVVNAASNFTPGAWAVLVVSTDNDATNGVAMAAFGVTDALGNTWTRRISPLYDPAAANNGVEGAIFTTPQNGGTIQTSTNITISWGSDSPARCAWALWEVTGDGTISYVTGNVNTGAATASPTVTTGSITSGDMVIAALFNESGTGQVVTGDADSTNGSWSSAVTVSTGLTEGGQTLSTQWKVVTATATQTYNPTLGTSSDVILGYIVLNDTGGGGGGGARSFAVIVG